MNPAAPTSVRRVAVIGGGISGLSAAHRLTELRSESQQPLDIMLFEASDRLAGVMGTEEIDGYHVETGADSFITDKPWAVDLAKRLGLEDRLISPDANYRRSLVLHNGKPQPIPEGFMLLAPSKIGPVLKSPLLSPWGKLRLGMEYILPRGNNGQDESLAHFVRRRLGREVLDRIVQPLVGGIYTSDPEKLSLRATLPRFLDMEKEHRSLIRASRRQSARRKDNSGSGARYGLFATFATGISELFAALIASLKNCDVRMNTAVTRLTPGPENASATLETADGRHEEFDAVIAALPAYRVGDLVAAFAAPLAAQLQSIEYASSAIVVTGHRLADVANPLNAFGLVIPAVENRKILAVSFTSRKFPDRAPNDCVQLRTFVGGAMQPELLELDDEQLLSLVRGELAELLGVQGEPQIARIARYQQAMPQYHVGHLERVERIEAAAAALPFFELAGNAYHGVGIPDCVHSGEQAAERVFSRI
ncbi:Protoporphyrinogen oxidase [Symmachiella dynata]|uniref:Coproporphyrinogen III oxidase n=1 Tax=Symmachiella dynata TaxID=2527995 RepID=A0A517ZRG1_9PLAN|nr:protoporphyrinogen oxidase [Symmachiella dynata]QDU45071.1 Protoporphyrinogen oxidase [Symmachiella dynata]